MPERILLVRIRHVGDVLLTTPCIRALRRSLPSSQIAYVVDAPADQVLRRNPRLDEVLVRPPGDSIPQQLGFIRGLRRRRFDIVIDFLGNPRSALMTWLSGAPRRIGFDVRVRRYAYTDVIPRGGPGEYMAMKFGRLLRPLDFSLRSTELEFFISDEERDLARDRLTGWGVGADDLVVSICPVSRRPPRLWPPERFARLADRLIDRLDARIVLVHGPGEEEAVDAVGARMRRTAVTCGFSRLAEARALFERVDLHVGNDNGLRHVAVAAGAPTVAVFGPADAASWTPPDDPMHRFLQAPSRRVEDVDVEAVWSAVSELTDRRRIDRAP